MVLKMMGEVCPYTVHRSLTCKYKEGRCPLQDAEFIKQVRRFLFFPRLKASTWDVVFSVPYAHEARQQWSADVFKCLPHGAKDIYLVLKFLYQFLDTTRPVSINMTYRLCRSIRSVRSRFNSKVRVRN